VSVQTLSEFYVTVRRLPEPLTHDEAAAQLELIARAARVLDLTAAIAFEALRGAGAHSLSMWDSLIWAAAKLNQVPFVLTEDFQHEHVIESVTFLDPFAATFDASMLR
jgi:predicted nucleic acid-binding protein